jgi:hypothetical protein
LRDAVGRLVFRPGGHGALIENLNQLNADLIFINIDNIIIYNNEHILGIKKHWQDYYWVAKSCFLAILHQLEKREVTDAAITEMSIS